jgi:hypothetical protein
MTGFEVTNLEQRYGPAIAGLLVPERVPELGPGSPNIAAKPLLQALDISAPCRAGLWLLHDFLHESHAISQDIDTQEGSFWHAIMHRREPDPSNSKYWWRRVGSHPVLDQLREQAPALGYAFTSPEVFVDFCERERGTSSDRERLARKVQQLEWQLLFDWCYRDCR